MTDPTAYKFTVSPPDDTDPPTNPIFTVDNLIGINPPFVTPPQIISVWSFLSSAQLADVKARTLTFDVAPAIQTAINYVLANAGAMPIRTLVFPAGAYRIESTINIPGPMYIVGAGKGSDNDAPTQAPTEIVWYGSGDPMMIFGSNGLADTFAGGGLRDFMLNGRHIATECLRVCDVIRFEIKNIAPEDATDKVICLANTKDPVRQATGFGVFENIWAAAGRTGTNIANALWVGSIGSGVNVGSSGVAACTFISCNFNSDQAASVRVTDRGDNFLWLRCSTGSANATTGPGTWFSGTDGDAVISDHVWVNHTGDFRFDKGMGIGQRIIDLNMADLSDPFFAEPRNIINGAGSSEVTADSNIGFMWGQNRTLGYRQTIVHDPMYLMYWDSANDIMHTNAGAWRTDVSGTSSVADAELGGGAVSLVTEAAVNAHAAIYNTPTLGTNSGGLIVFDGAHAVFSVGVDSGSTSGLVYRCGWVDSLTDPPTNGIYVEVDTSQSWQGWRYVCRASGVETEVNSGYAFNIADTIYQFRIELLGNPAATACFFARDQAFQFYEKQYITTNVPENVKLSFVFQAISLDGSVKTCNVFDYKMGFNTEG